MDRDALLTTTREEFLRAFTLAVDPALPRSAATLLRNAEATFSAPEQRRLLGAYGLIRECEAELNSHMRHSMDQLLNRSFQTTYSTFRPSFIDSYGSGGLTLLDTGVHEDLLRINDVTARFRHAADSQLRDLNIRIAILFEQDRINERENPFRPFLLSRAMATAIDNLGQPVDTNSTLFDRLAEDMRSEITAIYDAVNAHLASHGIAAQLQLKIQKSSEATDAGTARDTGDTGEPAARAIDPLRVDTGARALSSDTPRSRVEQLVDLVRQITRPFTASAGSNESVLKQDPRDPAGNNWPESQGLVASLQKLFSGTAAPMALDGAAAPSGESPAAPANRPVSAPLRESLDGLMSNAVPDAGQMALAGGDVRNLIFEQREALSAAAADGHEQMTIDVVAMLFEFILRDPQIPAEVRAQLGRLQFLVLKVALRESTLLTHKSHPARLLVNRIGSISIGLKQIDPGGARVSAEICRIVETLLADRSDNADLFTAMLDQFDAFIAQELRGNDSPVDHAIEALEKARSRTLRFAHLGASLAEILSGLDIDPFLRDFLSTTWVRVIERAERQHGTTAGRFRQLVPDLLWSIVPKNTAAQRSKLIAMLPALVGTLREGMLQENLSGIDRLAVLNWLVDVHSLALRGSDTAAADLPLEAMQLRFALFTNEPDTASGSSQESTATADSDPHHEGFLAEALQETDAELELLDPQFDHEADTSTPERTQPETDEVLERLRSGVAIDITLGAIPGTGRLHWIDHASTTLVLQMDGHPAPSMMSVRMFLRLLGLGRVGFSETAPLFERAVHALMLSAQQMEKTPV
ncbi:Thymidine phosphorylase [Oxalobacteraceae bacterium IMCC9480]|nr:Thymidine phosphorylase [Oxalobacteraceae bacterium IMCC9480]